jgi:arylsulfatase A-like enzyme
MNEGNLRAPSPPNILFIISDPHRWDTNGFAGHPVVKTSNPDALAAAYSSSVQAPARRSALVTPADLSTDSVEQPAEHLMIASPRSS